MEKKAIRSLIAVCLLSCSVTSQVSANKFNKIEVPVTTSSYNFIDIDGNSLLIQIQTSNSFVKIITKDPYGYIKDQEYSFALNNEPNQGDVSDKDRGSEPEISHNNPTVNNPPDQPALTKNPVPEVGGVPSTEVGEKNATLYRDVNKHWAKEDIGLLSFLGIVNGYQDGTFRPDSTITRAEFAVMLAKAVQQTKQNQQNSESSGFVDVNTSDWYYPYLHSLELHGSIDPEKYHYTLAPKEPITRQEIAQWLYVDAKYEQDKEPQYADISDTKTKDAITAAYSAGLLNGYPDLTFRPENKLTRAEAAAVILRYLQYKGVVTPIR